MGIVETNNEVVIRGIENIDDPDIHDALTSMVQWIRTVEGELSQKCEQLDQRINDKWEKKKEKKENSHSKVTIVLSIALVILTCLQVLNMFNVKL